MDKRFLTVRETATFLGISPSAIRLWISQNRLHAVRAGSRVLIDRVYLEQRAAGGQLLEPVCESEPTPNGPNGDKAIPRKAEAQ
jgi:excisionase family DNA binding protein